MSRDIPPDWQRRLSVAEYHRMVEAGVLAEGERVELLAGVLLRMSPQSAEHALPVQELGRRLTRGLGEAWRVRVQAPLALGADSEPEPDVAVVRTADFYAKGSHPRWARLVVEVVVSSVAVDRGLRAQVYARADIPEYWLVDVGAQRLEVRTGPDAATGTYEHTRLVSSGERLEVEGVAVDVADLFAGLR